MLDNSELRVGRGSELGSKVLAVAGESNNNQKIKPASLQLVGDAFGLLQAIRLHGGFLQPDREIFWADDNFLSVPNRLDEPLREIF